MNRNKELALKGLEYLIGDDLFRAKQAFEGLTDEQMDRQHGISGRTRREVLAEYERHDREVELAIAWVKSLPD
jgi:hypothetical protein